MTNDLPQTLEEAIASERRIAEEARELRRDATELTSELFMKLWELLRRPIPPAFIQTVPRFKGKPYESTGIKSVQVQMDRMDNVLTPMWWGYSDEYHLEGKLCLVTALVNDGRRTYVSRSSWGGVDYASTKGNQYKGSFTNACKLALARIGPGHEIYLGATDFDPDVSREMAETEVEPSGKINKGLAAKLVEKAWAAGENTRLQLAASRLVNKDVGECDTKAKATDALTGALTFAQADQLDKWLSEQEAKK